MRVQTHNRLSEIHDFKATRVVIYDDAGNPIAVAAQIGPDTCVTSVIGQPDFQPLLMNLGIHSTTVVQHLQHKPNSQLSLH